MECYNFQVHLLLIVLRQTEDITKRGLTSRSRLMRKIRMCFDLFPEAVQYSTEIPVPHKKQKGGLGVPPGKIIIE
jgi:hypothetical protein